jgi:hypothetical protein
VVSSEEEDSGQAGGMEPGVGVVLERAVSDCHRAGAIVADEEDRPATFGRVVAEERAAVDRE